MTVEERTLTGLLAHHGRVTPHRPAVSDGRSALSYGQLDRRAGQLAALLLEQGATPGTAVGLLVTPGIEAVVALYGVMKAGMVVVPLDQAAPDDALIDISHGAHLASVVVDDTSARRIPGLPQVVIASGTRGDTSSSSGNVALPVVHPDDPAAVYYTSGSTGRAKGFVITHEAQVRGAHSWCEGYGLRQDDRMALLFHQSFGASPVSLFGALALGAELCTYDVRRTGIVGLADALERDGVTFIHCAPSLLRSLLEPLPAGPNLPRVRLSATGAEALHRSDIELLRKHLSPGSRLAYTYAVSEAGPVSALFLDPSQDVGDGLLPVGRVLPGKKVTVESPDHEGIGEIVVSGDGLASGYWLDDARTAERFGPAPQDRTVRAFRTGDRGRLRADGFVELHGRVDRVVKVRGFRVDLADVERSVSSVAAVSEVSVKVWEGRRPRLVAYVAPEPGGPPIDVVALRAELSERVPPHMVPAAVVALDALPRTSRGKVDAASLPAVASSRPPLPTELVGPRDEVEAVIVSALESVLEMSPIGVHDDFFALGTDSLAVVELRTLIEQRLGREVPMAALLEGSTPAELARILRDGDDVEWRGSSLVPMRTSGSRPPLFLVHGGGGNVLMWRHLVARLSPDQPVYGLQITETPPRFLKSMDRLAGYYLRQIREVQPKGPYLLGGFSAGGAVAIAMASQLASAGQEPALVVNLDGLAPPVVRGRIARRFVGQLTRYAKLEAHWLGWRVRWALWRLSQIARTEPSPSPWHDANTSLRSSMLIMGRALVLHRPRPYHGRVLQLRTNTYRCIELGWERFVTSLDTITVPGDHRGMLDPPHADIVAAHIDAAIGSALGLQLPPGPRDSVRSSV